MQNFMNLPVRGLTQIGLFKRPKTLLAIAAAALIASGLSTYYVMHGAKLPFVSNEATTCELAIAKWENDNPQLGTPHEVFTGEPAAVDFEATRFPRAKEFKSAITEAVQKGPHFAGKYAVAQWGCGTSCQEHAVVNVETGEIVALGIESEASISTTRTYSVLITNPRENLPKPEDLKRANPDSLAYLLNIPREYYLLMEEGTTTRLKKICTENPFEGIGI